MLCFVLTNIKKIFRESDIHKDLMTKSPQDLFLLLFKENYAVFEFDLHK